MNIIVVSDYEEMSEKACLLFSQAIKENPKLVLGLATGSTPLGLYQRLVKMVQNGQISFRDVTSFNLDEYVGLPADHPQSYRYFMNQNLFSQVDIKLENTFVPSGVAPNLEKECEEYTKKLA
ncbi:MAG: 6-phosphogluconolactonase, partial [Bacilli bacterium]|nr:6-phosphogluconolactonase [Bacilli bacterium]